MAGFSDSDQIGSWAKAAVQAAAALGLIKGDEAALRPNKLLTRAETATLIHRMLGILARLFF